MRLKYFLLIPLCLCFFSCFLRKNNSSEPPELPVIGVTMNINNESVYIKTLYDHLRKHAEGRATLLFKDSEHNQMIQHSNIDELLEQGIDALIILLARNNPPASVMSKVQHKNIPVIFIVVDPGIEIIDFWDNAYFAGSSPLESGRMSTEILLSYFKDNPKADFNGDGIIQYVVLMGSKNNKFVLDRTQAYADTLTFHGKRGGFSGEVLAQEFAWWGRKLAYEKTLMFFEQFPNQIEAILANSDEMALGALQAIQEKGYNKPISSYDSRRSGNKKKSKKYYIPIVGNNGYPETVNAILRGEILGTVFESTYSQSLDAVNIAVSLHRGEDPSTDLSGSLTDYTGVFVGNYSWVPHQKITGGNCKNFLGSIKY